MLKKHGQNIFNQKDDNATLLRKQDFSRFITDITDTPQKC